MVNAEWRQSSAWLEACCQIPYLYPFSSSNIETIWPCLKFDEEALPSRKRQFDRWIPLHNESIIWEWTRRVSIRIQWSRPLLRIILFRSSYRYSRLLARLRPTQIDEVGFYHACHVYRTKVKVKVKAMVKARTDLVQTRSCPSLYPYPRSRAPSPTRTTFPLSPHSVSPPLSQTKPNSQLNNYLQSDYFHWCLRPIAQELSPQPTHLLIDLHFHPLECIYRRQSAEPGRHQLSVASSWG